MGGTVGIGIIGTGRWARAHAAAAARTGNVEIVNCFSRSAEGRAAFADEVGVARTSATLDELLADDAVEGIVISSPNDLHVEITLASIERGKAVLVDKPLAVDVVEGLRLVREVEKTGALVGVAHHARRLAGHRAAREWIGSGRAGRVRLAHAAFSNPRGASQPADAWQRRVRGSEAGVLIQVGIHQVENLMYLLGPALSVNARFGYGAVGPETPEIAAVTMTHSGGAISSVLSGWATPGHYRLDVQATEANLLYRMPHGRWTSPAVDEHSELLVETVDGSVTPVALDRGEPLTEQLQELGRAARDGIPMEVGVIDGMRAVAVVEAAVRSAGAGGAPVDIADLLQSAGATEQEIAQVVGP